MDSGVSPNRTTGDYLENGDVNNKDKKFAKEINQWMPHSHPVRNINTSTK